MRSSAQNRLTAVGRLAAKCTRHRPHDASRPGPAVRIQADTTPYAAAIPIAGAPRTRTIRSLPKPCSIATIDKPNSAEQRLVDQPQVTGHAANPGSVWPDSAMARACRFARHPSLVSPSDRQDSRSVADSRFFQDFVHERPLETRRTAAQLGSAVARIWTANRPAFRGPPIPTATQATGTSPGIWTMESSESSPPNSAVGTGRPITGKGV